MNEQPFSYSYGPNTPPAEIARLRAVAAAAAKARGLNRPSEGWQLNDCGEWPGPCLAVRLRCGRFLECEDASDSLLWDKTGDDDEIVEYLPEPGGVRL